MPRTVVRLVAALIAAPLVIGLAPTAAQAAPPPKGRVIIGDSVVGMNTAVMKARGFTVNFSVSRQFSAAPGLLRSYGSRLPRNVVVHLGTNGTISLATCKEVVRIAGASRTVFLVTVRVPRSWERSNNATLRSCASSFPSSRVRLIDWYALSNPNPSWFYSDGYHPRESSGAVRYAELISRAVKQYGR
jgi:hypothetical protein